ncbi:helix-turn-helix transcriptional regulator [Staphylococcus sp. ACRSN]|uniref:helix-turn-helix domain-containing protein n=1 Tax=Staphylococcus TaxID=1279 RepID=UPI001EF28507|nr:MULTISPECIES: helix-turn-helix transcriptional regulator [Staphylococcus]MCG7340161.1 helix-turn-helix transcriptional regulator [Staphylococcus sp. ACRSN]MEB6279106.1 helix-turn-helix transcriptional regulator [Staphylococcus gallinarum]
MKSNNELLKLHKYICLELKHQRNLQKLRQDKVAFDLGFPASYLSNIENGKKETTSLVTYLKIANYYDVDFKSILYKAEEKLKLDENL